MQGFADSEATRPIAAMLRKLLELGAGPVQEMSGTVSRRIAGRMNRQVLTCMKISLQPKSKLRGLALGASGGFPFLVRKQQGGGLA